MSYDAYIVKDVAHVANHTSNTRDMMEKALGCPLGELNGLPVEEAQRFLEEGVKRMALNPEDYVALEAPNGWGTVASTRDFLAKCANACDEAEEGDKFRVNF